MTGNEGLNAATGEYEDLVRRPASSTRQGHPLGAAERRVDRGAVPHHRGVIADKPDCFYPMSKKREGHANWFATPYDDRNDMMMEHGKSGRTFAGRVAQLVTGSTGLDDFEWGVTLFAVSPDVLKDVVYTMRFDKGSALYGEFGAFYVGYLDFIENIL
jgi:hypothetical protein